MIIGSWDVEHADDREKWTDLRTDYIVIRLDFNREEMEQLEKSLKIAKALASLTTITKSSSIANSESATLQIVTCPE